MFDVEQIEAKAYVNHGRWIVDCPADDCNNAENVSPGVMEITCTNCQQVMLIAHPAEWQAIVDLLVMRPNVENQNWYPGETVDDLRRENQEHGVSS